MVGQKFFTLLKERRFPVKELRLFAGSKSEGRKLSFRGRKLQVQSLREACFLGLDIVFFSAGEQVSRKWADHAVRAGAVVIDNSSAFRMKKEVPLIVPEVNGWELSDRRRGFIIANPNCSTIQLVLALKPLNLEFGLKSVNVSSYQSLSGAGKKAVDLLKKESQAILNEESGRIFEKAGGRANPAEKARGQKSLLVLSSEDKSSAFNCIPQIGALNEEGFSTEEAKLMRETKKILNLPDLKISATAVRVPTFNGHGEAVTVTFKKPANITEITKVLEKQKGLTVLSKGHLPHQRFVDGKDDVFAGRIRPVPGEKGKSWMMWLAGDNLRKGAALNGLQIAEQLFRTRNKT